MSCVQARPGQTKCDGPPCLRKGRAQVSATEPPHTRCPCPCLTAPPQSSARLTECVYQVGRTPSLRVLLPGEPGSRPLLRYAAACLLDGAGRPGDRAVLLRGRAYDREHCELASA